MRRRITNASGKRSEWTRAAALLSVVFVSSLSRIASGDVAACIDSHATGQREAKAGRLELALELFTSCGANEDCPPPIREDCVELYRSVEASLPTVIFSAMGEHGRDVTSVRVYSGEDLVVDGLDGRAVALDPGKYLFRFVFPDGTTVQSGVLVREGEKNRVVAVRWRDRSGRAPGLGAAGEPGASAAASETEASSLPAGFWVSTGVSAAALASWGVFSLLGRSHQSKIDECSPDCTSSVREDYDAMRQSYMIGDISLGVAIASAGLAAWFYFPGQGSTVESAGATGSTRGTRLSLQPLGTAPGARLVVDTDAL